MRDTPRNNARACEAQHLPPDHTGTGYARRPDEPQSEPQKAEPSLTFLLSEAACLSSAAQKGAAADVDLDKLCRGPLAKAVAGLLREGQVVHEDDDCGVRQCFQFVGGRLYPWDPPALYTAGQLEEARAAKAAKAGEAGGGAEGEPAPVPSSNLNVLHLMIPLPNGAA